MIYKRWSPERGSLDLRTLGRLYSLHQLTPTQLVTQIYQRIRAASCPNVWITLLEESVAMARARQLEELAHTQGMSSLPLFGVPFAVKDNIDVAGIPTTAACRDYAHTPKASSPVVEKLLAAGAILIGKTNLDQFATGLTGLLSSFGATQNPFDPAYISGGSSSGSAVAVSAGLVSFSLGTDTAGSGRVPAAFNHLVGLKPTRGVLSTRGLVPACRSLDCLSILALNVDDASRLLQITKAFDPFDPFSRQQSSEMDLNLLSLPISSFRFGMPPREQLEFYGDSAAEALYYAAAERLERMGGRRITIDAYSFLEAGRLLYQGPWIAERYIALSSLLAERPDAFHPVTKSIIERGQAPTGADVFRASYKLADLRRKSEAQWALMDFLFLPTAGRIFTSAEASVDPAGTSAKLGLYTNFVNLLDLAAIALPAGFTPNKLPFGVTLIGPAFSEPDLLALGQRFHTDSHGGLTGAADPAPQDPQALVESDSMDVSRTQLCVVGAHLSNQPLNHQLIELDGKLVTRTKTAPTYRLFALANTTPPKPGLSRCGPTEAGVAIEVEVWSLPDKHVAAFMARVPPPLCLGNILLESGRQVKGFLCEAYALQGATDISEFGGWVAFLTKNSESLRHARAAAV